MNEVKRIIGEKPDSKGPSPTQNELGNKDASGTVFSPPKEGQ